MIVRKKEDIKGTKGEVYAENWSSWRFLHKQDGMGVTLTEGILEDIATARRYEIKPGTLYALDKHDQHRLKVTTRMRVICTFFPALVGGEIHDAEGSYPIEDEHE